MYVAHISCLSELGFDTRETVSASVSITKNVLLQNKFTTSTSCSTSFTLAEVTATLGTHPWLLNLVPTSLLGSKILYEQQGLKQY